MVIEKQSVWVFFFDASSLRTLALLNFIVDDSSTSHHNSCMDEVLVLLPNDTGSMAPSFRRCWRLKVFPVSCFAYSLYISRLSRRFVATAKISIEFSTIGMHSGKASARSARYIWRRNWQRREVLHCLRHATSRISVPDRPTSPQLGDKTSANKQHLLRSVLKP